MSRRLLPMLGLIGAAAAVLLTLVLFGLPSPAPAQKAVEPTTPATMPAGYVGARRPARAVTKRPGRSSRARRWAGSSSSRPGTRGKPRLRELPRTRARPRRGGRRQGCGRPDHVRQERPHADRAAKPDVPHLPHQGHAGVLEGQRPRLARRGLHQLPQGDGGPFPPGSACEVDRDRDVRHVPPAEAGRADALVAHAPARGQDDLHVVPQSARDGHAGAPQGELAQRQLLPVPHREARARSCGSTRPSSRTARTATTRTARTTSACSRWPSPDSASNATSSRGIPPARTDAIPGRSSS